MQWYIIETPRLKLRALTPEVYNYVFTHYSDEELKEFFGCFSDKDLEEERKKWQEGLSMYKKSLLIFQLIDKTDALVIGWCGYHTWYTTHYRAELGYVLTNESKRNNGFMKEALPFILNYGFNEMNLHRVEAMIAKYNIASLKLLLKIGFKKEGTLREHYYVNDKAEDSEMYALLKKEYISN
jgi:[ribosomal protein S5]-alanine N-acetyltransferase